MAAPPPDFGHASLGLWMLEAGGVHLNHGSFGAVPRAVLAAADRERERNERNPVRFFVEETPARIRAAADRLGASLGVDGQELAFVENATQGVNCVLGSLELNAGDELVTTDHVYPAVLNTLRYLAGRRGARVVVAPVRFPGTGPEDVVGAVTEALTPRTRVVVVDHVTSPTAIVFPVEEIVRRCHERGVPVLVDGAHAPGMLELDLQEVGADWYVGNCHKWLFAPRGCALLRRNPAASIPGADVVLHPTSISHGLGQPFPAEFDWVGTRSLAAWLALPAALDFVGTFGALRLREHNRHLAAEGAAILRAAWGEEAPVSPAMHGSMALVGLPGRWEATNEAGMALARRTWEEHRVECAFTAFAGRLWARVSAQAYNEPDDYRRLAGLFGGAA